MCGRAKSTSQFSFSNQQGMELLQPALVNQTQKDSKKKKSNTKGAVGRTRNQLVLT
jgi:hypothetical protein